MERCLSCFLAKAPALGDPGSLPLLVSLRWGFVPQVLAEGKWGTTQPLRFTTKPPSSKPRGRRARPKSEAGAALPGGGAGDERPEGLGFRWFRSHGESTARHGGSFGCRDSQKAIRSAILSPRVK